MPNLHAKVVLAIDVMGGDNAPQAALKGCMGVLKKNKNIFFKLVGDQKKISFYLEKNNALRKVSQIIHTKEAVTALDKPSRVLRTGINTSMALAVAEVAENRADAVVSAGNTGVFMAMAMFAFKRIEGIDRPAICSSFPTMRDQTCVLDLGANLDNSALELCQFALLGSEFARAHFGIKKPTVGIINIGSEDTKGFDYLQEAADILSSGKKPFDKINYYGFIEGDDIAKGTVDVCITNGFTGNVILKTAEGIGRLVSRKLRETFLADLRTKISYLLAHHELKKIKNFLDPRLYNGAPLLGLNKIAVKSHGGSDDVAFMSAVVLAYELVSKNIVHNIKCNLEENNR